ncbi:tripartite tricarboxylate transporter TctB family protein [Orrella sp. 11846]|uniref:tripartite tricarboxylate transporter TctB family protein n=1 Tax=Orrella sp. 11846 TaxID=3409913 RepID=UPI003B5C706E
MTQKNWLKRVDWGHVIVVLALSAGIALYLTDTINASKRLGNLVFILPASILGLILCLLVLLSIFRDALRSGAAAASGESATSADESSKETFYERVRPLLMMVLFAIYVLLMPVLGMDLASVLFMIVALILNGERHPGMVIGFSVVFALLATLIFKWILPYPMHTLFL